MRRLFVFVAMYTLFMVTVQAQQAKPNIVFILADDLGIGDLGVYGQEKISTPNIDRLAAQGMQFSQFYAGTSVCAPSRSSLLTGQHTGHTYIRGNKEIMPEGQEPLADSIRTFAMILQEQGYHTGAFGKWGLGMVGTQGEPNRKGFDTFFGYNCQRQSHRYYPTHLWDNQEKLVLEGNELRYQQHYAPALIQERALEFIEKNKDQPFFLFVPSVLPHAELAGPHDEHYSKYEHAFEETPHRGNDYGPHAAVAGYTSVDKPRATFAAMVSRLDAQVGEIVAKLDELGLAENTIIIFSSDNGAHREGGADPEFFNSNASFRGYKRELYEGGIRTPFIVRWKGTVADGVTSDHRAAFWDVLPTIQAIAGASKKEQTDGISFLPTLLGTTKQKKHMQLYWEFHEDGGSQAVRYKNYKLIRFNVAKPESSYHELYDLAVDPKEQHPIENSRIEKKLLKMIDKQHRESDLFPLTAREALSKQ